jgi:hypothetical protein
MDVDEIDLSLHEIEQMVLVSLGAQESIFGSDARPGFFEMPEADAEMLAFAILDLQKRVKALRADLYPRESAKAPVLTLIPSRPDLSA